jgi:carboxypeptidase Q
VDPETLDALVDAALVDTWTYERLEELCDEIGPRLAGSPGMAKAKEWSVRSMREAGFDTVWMEEVEVDLWTRGREWARVTAPVAFELEMIGLGHSDGTGPAGIEAEVMVVGGFEELSVRSAEVPGKIVLFDMPWEGYGSVATYRVHGNSPAAEFGAVATLVRSATGRSLGTPHTGMMRYAEGAPRIPAAALTVEDAGRIRRLVDGGHKVRIHLYMEAENKGTTICHNVVGEVRGRELPDEIVLLGAHLDAWDAGTGAHDDGGGCAMVLGAARQLLQQDLRPRRTVRVVHYTAEENGIHGGKAYLEAHRDELDRHVLALESDSGSYAPRGFTIDAEDAVIADIAARCAPLARLAPDHWTVRRGGSGADIGPIVRQGVVGVGHRVDGTHYFDVHHSGADTFDKIDPLELARNVAAIAGLAYLVAEPTARPGASSSGGSE